MSPNAASLAQQLPHLAIVDRLVTEFPLVNSALDFANARYSQLKSSSIPLVSSTLDRAEKSLEYVVTTAVVPVLNQLEQPIHYADNKAVQGLDLVQAKIGSLQKQSGELKDSGLKLIDQTKTRIQAVKSSTLTTVQSKVHSVLTLPSNVVPLVDQILSAGENVLDYLLPSNDPKDAKAQQNGSDNKIPEEEEDPKDTRALIRLVFVRMRAFTEKVQKRVVDYSRERWIPALFSKVVIIKGNLSQLVANGAAAGNKLLQANGHASQAEPEASTQKPQAQSTPNPSPAKSTSSSPSKKSSTNTKATSTSSSNGDVNKQQQQQEAQPQAS